jgi:class 3 adenylate cyclase
MDLPHEDERSGQQHWLKTYQVRWQAVAAVGVFWLVVFLGLSWSQGGAYLEAKIADPMHFRLRDLLGKAPAQDPRLKIFAIDDQTFGMLGTPMPGLDVWADVLDAITVQKPKIVLIDAMFSARPDDMTAKTRQLLQTVQQSQVPIVTGAFISETEIRFKDPLTTAGEQYQKSHYLDSTSGHEWGGDHMPRWQDRASWFAYGPSKGVAEFFANASHFQLFAENKVEPFVWLGGDQVIPHMSMSVADSVRFRGGSIEVNGKKVALDRLGAVPVNFLPRNHWTIYSMDGLIRKAQQGYAASGVKEGDVVLILPLYFTGNVDLRPSPYGWIPGGLYMAAMINSVLTEQWLQPVMMSETLVVVFTMLSVLLAITLPSVRYWQLWVVGVGAAMLISESLFVFAGLVIPYILPLVAATVTGAHVFILRVRSTERKTAALRAALDGAVSPSQMERMIKQADRLNFEPRERVVTLMFVDVVGFSLSSENMLPRLAFDNLKNILGQITALVHQHGGVVDKTLGDGLLCYFGYKLESDETETDHPERALRCAIAIQEQSLTETLRCAEQGLPIYPLRIGVNTASCYIGDIGSGHRIEFTVVGNGVNFAKRLEAACDNYAIMIGSTTYDLIKGLDMNAGRFKRKVFKIKHHAELMDAFEVDPFADRPDDKAKAIDAFRHVAQLQRLNERLIIRESDRITVTTNHGEARLLNFSGSGLSLELKSALSRGMPLTMRLESREPGLAAALKNEGIDELVGEVRWAYVSSAGVVHGIMFTELSREQMLAFSKLVAEFAFVHGSGPRGGVDDLSRLRVG